MRIGYYDVEAGAGLTAQAEVIQALGQNPFFRDDLQAADTQRAGVLFIQNGNSAGYTPEFLAAGNNVVSYVLQGGVAIFHDAAVTTGALLLQGLGIEVTAVADAASPAAGDIDFTGDFTPLTDGPAGALDDLSLDGGAPSSEGYITLASVQDSQVAFLTTRADPGQGVTMLTAAGSGYALYSTIALGDFLGGASALDDAMEVYAGNVVRYATRLAQAQDVAFGGGDDTYTTTDAGQDVFGGGGADVLTANHKRSLVHGENGDDVIDLSGHADIAWGGAGNDQIFGSHADDQLWGGGDSDRLKGANGDDFLVGGTSADRLVGGEGDDKLFGGDGDDTLRGGLGRDWHDGGQGADRFIFTNDGVGTNPGTFAPAGGPVVTGVGAASDYVAHFEIAAGDLIDIRAFGPIDFAGAAYGPPFFPQFVIEDNLTGIDRVLLDWDEDGVTDFEIHVEDADGVLTSADIDWIPYPT